MAAIIEQVEAPADLRPEVVGRNPWALAARRLWRNRLAMAALGLFLLIVVACLAAPLYAEHIAHVNPFAPNLNGTTVINGKVVPVMQQGGGTLKLGETPIGPTWDPHHYFLGADLPRPGRGRAAAVRRAQFAAYRHRLGGDLLRDRHRDRAHRRLLRRGHGLRSCPGSWTSSGPSRVFLLRFCISTELLTHSSGFQFGPVHVSASSLWLPTLIIAFIYLPYVYRPVRGQVLSVVQKEFVEAAIASGASNLRLVFSEVLPNVVSTVIVLLPLMIATTILTEVALSFLSIGVQPPNVSWGTVISDGESLLYTRPWVSIAPGIMIVLTVLALNVLGDGVRDALDPRAKLRVEG